MIWSFVKICKGFARAHSLVCVKKQTLMCTGYLYCTCGREIVDNIH